MTDALIIAFAIVAVASLGVAAWHQVQIARIIKPILDAATKWNAEVANYSDVFEAKVARKAAAETAKIQKILADAGYMVPASFNQTPVGDAPPAPNVRPEAESGLPARETGRLNEMHERQREILRKHDEEAPTDARDAVSFQGADVDV